MIIHISIPQDRIVNLSNQNIDDFLFCLRSVISRGTHFVVMERENCIFLEKRTENKEFLAIIRRLYDEYTTTGSIVDGAPVCIKVVDTGEKYEKVGENFHIGVGKLAIFKPDDYPILLVENELNDGDYYKELIL